MINLRQFAKTAGAYLLGSVLTKLISFFLLPLYTVYLSPEQYGIYDVVFSFINLVGPIAFLQVWDSMFRFSFDTTNSQQKYALVSNCFAVCVPCLSVYYLIWTIIYQVFKFEYFGLVVVYGFLFILNYVYTFAARAFLDNTLFVGSGVISTLVTALLNIVLIVKLGWGVNALYTSAIFGIIVQNFIIELKLKLVSHFCIKDIDFSLIKKMIRFSAPLCMATISYWLLSGFSRMVINQILAAADNGLYAVANKFATLITLFVSIFQFAWNEAAYLMAKDDNRKDVYGVITSFLLKVVLWGISIAVIGIKIIFPYFVDNQYIDALLIIPATIAGTAVNSLAGFLGTVFSTEKKTSFIMTSTLIASVCNVVGAVIGAHILGLQGVVIALMISFLVLLVLRIHKLIKMGMLQRITSYGYSLAITIIATILFYTISNIWLLCGTLFAMVLLFLLNIRNELIIFLNSKTQKDSSL